MKKVLLFSMITFASCMVYASEEQKAFRRMEKLIRNCAQQSEILPNEKSDSVKGKKYVACVVGLDSAGIVTANAFRGQMYTNRQRQAFFNAWDKLRENPYTIAELNTLAMENLGQLPQEKRV